MNALATILAALVGGVIGSLGAQWLGERYRRAQSAEAMRREVATRHLVQLQDALVSLWFRIDNLVNQAGRSVMTSDYFELSSAYVLANFLAQKRLLVIEGAYANLAVFGEAFPSELGTSLEQLDEAFGGGFEGASYQRYQRQALGELLIRWDGRWRVFTYTEFVQLAEDSATALAVEPAVLFLKQLDSSTGDPILTTSGDLIERVGTATGLPIPEAILGREA